MRWCHTLRVRPSLLELFLATKNNKMVLFFWFLLSWNESLFVNLVLLSFGKRNSLRILWVEYGDISSWCREFKRLLFPREELFFMAASYNWLLARRLREVTVGLGQCETCLQSKYFLSGLGWNQWRVSPAERQWLVSVKCDRARSSRSVWCWRDCSP